MINLDEYRDSMEVIKAYPKRIEILDKVKEMLYDESDCVYMRALFMEVDRARLNLMYELTLHEEYIADVKRKG